jgi:hypothetical protein
MASAAFPPLPLIPLVTQIAAILTERKETVAVAETAAGGLVSAALLSVPGASKYFQGGLTVYTPASRIAYAGWTDRDFADYKCVRIWISLFLFGLASEAGSGLMVRMLQWPNHGDCRTSRCVHAQDALRDVLYLRVRHRGSCSEPQGCLRAQPHAVSPAFPARLSSDSQREMLQSLNAQGILRPRSVIARQ